MLERHDAHDGRHNAHQSPEHRRVLTIRPMTDREVPLSGAASMSISDVPVEVHQWLDGELSERIARHTDSRNVELWNRIATETGRRHRMHTPSQFSERVMAVLPSKAPSTLDRLQRPFRVTPLAASAVAAALLAAGVFAGQFFAR
jgi:hypothetical protein